MLRINSTKSIKLLIKANQCNITIQGIQPINLDWTLAAKGRIDVSQTICNSIYKLKIHQVLHKSIHLQLCIALPKLVKRFFIHIKIVLPPINNV